MIGRLTRLVGHHTLVSVLHRTFTPSTYTRPQHYPLVHLRQSLSLKLSWFGLLHLVSPSWLDQDNAVSKTREKRYTNLRRYFISRCLTAFPEETVEILLSYLCPPRCGVVCSSHSNLLQSIFQ